MRELLRRLGAGGRTTVFLSSHLLAEVQQVCDDVSIIARGRLVASGPVSQVLASHASGDVRLRAPDPVAVREVLERAGYRVASLGDVWRVSGAPDPSALTRLLADHGHYVSELAPVTADRESVFLDLTQCPGVGDGLLPEPSPA